MHLYSVTADRETGEWLGQPILIGMINPQQHYAKSDTDAVHYDTFEEDDVLCAVEVTWVS